ncbi:hypothetical protein [Candidatus Kuenenia sp.]|uniref:hypothetical protein n=1 Tax=Candidatus Kuenenia sp. TaxID=2499824 RepID=UPI00321FBC89
MHPVVSDSDVIIHLAKLDELKLLKELFGYVNIPRYVESEVVHDQNNEVVAIKEAINKGILKVHNADERKAIKIAKRYGIHIGESHVKEVAERLKAKVFLSNEKKVRIAAKLEGFTAVGTIGVILSSVTKKFLTKEEAIGLLNKLKVREFRIHPSIIKQATNLLEA